MIGLRCSECGQRSPFLPKIKGLEERASALHDELDFCCAVDRTKEGEVEKILVALRAQRQEDLERGCRAVCYDHAKGDHHSPSCHQIRTAFAEEEGK